LLGYQNIFRRDILRFTISWDENRKWQCAAGAWVRDAIPARQKSCCLCPQRSNYGFKSESL